MYSVLKQYLKILYDKSIKDKNDVIMNMGLLLEKNGPVNNPTDYSLLLPPELVNLSLSTKDKEDIVTCLLTVLKNEPNYSSRIVWSIGKTFNERDIELMLLTVLQLKKWDEDTFSQISFLVDVVNNERINNLFNDICLLKNEN